VTRPLTLEIAVSTPDEAAEAERAGADRLELSGALDAGGVTPSLGLFRAVREEVRVPVWVLVRPRPGGFAYSEREFAVMRADAELFLSEGAAGIVLGVLTPDGRIDRERSRALVELAKGRAVFHRAFDFLPESLEALDELTDLGFARVLTSGGASTAEAGAKRLASLVGRAGTRIEVLPAGSIRPQNVAALVRATGCTQVHAAARADAPDPLLAAHPQLAAGMGRAAATSAALVRGLREQLDRLPGSLS
jgi:copper homeostasis protein